jgi:membrane-associated protease RseP (regulator of RpoE activity)
VLFEFWERKRSPAVRPNLIVALLLAAEGAGCVAPQKAALGVVGDAGSREVSGGTSASTQTSGASSGPQPPKVGTAPSTLAAYEVRESAFSDFGMSVKTNLEVSWGGAVEWMFVTRVAAGSSASNVGLAPGDRILAIDGRTVSEMDREAMLAALFQRKKGDQSRLLVLGQREALPRFVTLVANRPGDMKR